MVLKAHQTDKLESISGPNGTLAAHPLVKQSCRRNPFNFSSFDQAWNIGPGAGPDRGQPVWAQHVRANLYKLLPLIVVTMTAAIACASQEADATHVEAEPGVAVIRISGAGGTTSVLRGLAEEYTRNNSNVSFKFLEGSGSGGGVKGVNADLLDLGAMSREPNGIGS